MRSNPLPVVRPIQGDVPSLVRDLRDPRIRNQTGLFVAEGLRFLLKSIEHRIPIAAVILGPGRPIPGDLIAQLKITGCPVERLNASDFSWLSSLEDNHEIIIVLHQTWSGLPSRVGRSDLWLGVDTIKNPGNLGTLIRSAAGAGAAGLMVFGPPRDRADPFDPTCTRASMGAILSMKIVATSHAEFRNWRHRYELTAIGATGSAQLDYRTVSYRRPVLLMLGHERMGLSEAQLNTADALVRIRLASGIDSLNVSMAGTVLLFEAYSQRNPVRRR